MQFIIQSNLYVCLFFLLHDAFTVPKNTGHFVWWYQSNSSLIYCITKYFFNELSVVWCLICTKVKILLLICQQVCNFGMFLWERRTDRCVNMAMGEPIPHQCLCAIFVTRKPQIIAHEMLFIQSSCSVTILMPQHSAADWRNIAQQIPVKITVFKSHQRHPYSLSLISSCHSRVCIDTVVHVCFHRGKHYMVVRTKILIICPDVSTELTLCEYKEQRL